MQVEFLGSRIGLVEMCMAHFEDSVKKDNGKMSNPFQCVRPPDEMCFFWSPISAIALLYSMPDETP